MYLWNCCSGYHVLTHIAQIWRRVYCFVASYFSFFLNILISLCPCGSISSIHPLAREWKRQLRIEAAVDNYQRGNLLRKMSVCQACVIHLAGRACSTIFPIEIENGPALRYLMAPYNLYLLRCTSDSRTPGKRRRWSKVSSLLETLGYSTCTVPPEFRVSFTAFFVGKPNKHLEFTTRAASACSYRVPLKYLPCIIRYVYPH